MAADPLGQFLTSLLEGELLDPGQRRKLEGELRLAFPTVATLARELVRLGWLTPHQANMLHRGRGRELLFGQYVLLDRLAGGGMGQVFKARHRQLGRIEALKVIRDDLLTDPDLAAHLLARFRREVEATARASHPNIVKVHYADSHQGRPFMVMEYLEGTDLDSLVRKDGPLTLERACACIAQAAAGLHHLHERGMVHRDIKPRNLLLTADQQIKILDLGLVLFLTAPQEQTADELTQPGGVMGTRAYMAPEQLANPHAVDRRADLYSLGGTCFYLLTGQPPPAVPTEVGQQLYALRPETPPPLIAIVTRLMAHRPEERYQTAAELAAALGMVRASQVAAPVAIPVAPLAIPVPDGRTVTLPPTASPPASAVQGTVLPPAEDTVPVRTSAPQRRRPWGLLAGGVAAVALALGACGGGSYGLLRLARVAPRANRPAQNDPTAGLLPAAGPRPRPTTPPEPAGALGESRLLTRHSTGVLSVAFLPDGARALSCTHREVFLWDIKSGTVLKRYPPERGFELPKAPPDIKPGEPPKMPAWEDLILDHAPIVAVAVSPNGRRAVFGGMDHIVLWDVEGWKKVRSAGKTAGGVLRGCVACSPDGRHALHVDQSDIVHLWDLEKEVELPVTYPGRVACFSPDGLQVLVGPREQAGGKVALHLHEFNREKRLAQLGEHAGDVTCVAFSPDRRRVLSAGSREQDAVLWDLDVRREVLRFKGHTKVVRGVAFSPDGKRVLTGSEDRTVRLWDVESGQQLGAFEEHTGPVNQVAFSPGGSYALSGSADQTVGVWQLPK